MVIVLNSANAGQLASVRAKIARFQVVLVVFNAWHQRSQALPFFSSPQGGCSREGRGTANTGCTLGVAALGSWDITVSIEIHQKKKDAPTLRATPELDPPTSSARSPIASVNRQCPPTPVAR